MSNISDLVTVAVADGTTEYTLTFTVTSAAMQNSPLDEIQNAVKGHLEEGLAQLIAGIISDYR